MKWYLVRNRTSDTLTMRELLDDAANGYWSLKGHSRPNDSEEEYNALVQEGLFDGHSETVIKILDQNDKGQGVFVENGLREGIQQRFIIRKVESPRHIWTEIPLIDSEESDEDPIENE